MKTFLFIVVVAIIALGGQFLAAQDFQQPTPEQQAWVECVQRRAMAYVNETINNQEKAEADLCRFLGAETGEECDSRVQALTELGMIQGEMNRFLLQTVLVPACGNPPR